MTEETQTQTPSSRWKTEITTDDLVVINGRNDVRTHRIIVISLGGVAGLATVGTIILAAIQVPIPESLVAIASASVGSLASMIAAVMGSGDNSKMRLP